MSAFRDPGSLNRRMVLQAAQDSEDGAGGAVRGWQDVQSFWAALRVVSAREAVGNGSLEQRITHEAVFRAGPQLSTAHRLTLGARVFRIAAVRDVDDTGTHRSAFLEEVLP